MPVRYKIPILLLLLLGNCIIGSIISPHEPSWWLVVWSVRLVGTYVGRSVTISYIGTEVTLPCSYQHLFKKYVKLHVNIEMGKKEVGWFFKILEGEAAHHPDIIYVHICTMYIHGWKFWSVSLIDNILLSRKKHI